MFFGTPTVLMSVVVKGVVCKKNVAHRRMTSKIEKPRLLILGGALEYQRVSNLLSSFDTLLQQEMDHLKMAVEKIDAHHPDVLLVEKSVSRFAQEYLLAKDISLVLNIKRPLLERISRCTAGQGGRKSVKTLMFFEGCPKPLSYTANTTTDNNVAITGNHLIVKSFDSSEAMKHIIGDSVPNGDAVDSNQLGLETSSQQDTKDQHEAGYAKEEFSPTNSHHQSILVSLSSRCVWKGIVCERSHLFRIKYYGSFDKPLGQFLRDHLFDQGAKVLLRGKRHSLGMIFYEPTIIGNVKNDMLLSREEVFVPVAPLLWFKTEEEAINIANDTNAGLHMM